MWYRGSSYFMISHNSWSPLFRDSISGLFETENLEKYFFLCIFFQLFFLFLAHENKTKKPSKVAHNRPQTFFFMYWPCCHKPAQIWFDLILTILWQQFMFMLMIFFLLQTLDLRFCITYILKIHRFSFEAP